MHKFLEQLQTDLAADKPAIPAFKKACENYKEEQYTDFDNGVAVADLVTTAAQWMDDLIRLAWQHTNLHYASNTQHDIALIAAGGYGRGELHPCSDVDLLLLTETPEAHSELIGQFITFLWDIKLDLGHSVRTIQESINEARADVSTATTMLETRFIIGNKIHYDTLQSAISPDNMWPNNIFFSAKLEEQEARHAQFHGSGYRLEPNLKESPGGLRDIQMIAWVTQRHFGAGTTLASLTAENFLYDAEYEALEQDRNFLWRIRFALHRITGRKQDQLMFDHQVKVAEMLGYGDANKDGQRNHLAVEAFMQAYYKTAKRVQRITSMLLQLFSEAILQNDVDETPIEIPESPRFVIRNNTLDVVSETVFQTYPLAVMEAFYLYQLYPDLDGFRAQTARLIRKYRYVIDDTFRNDIRAKSLFIEIMRQQHGLTHALRQMNRFGLLGAYLPAWGKIVGMMQFDLFHRYTVDEHSLFVLSNARKFALDRFNEQLPMQNGIMQQEIRKPYLLYLAALFHDIAKGRGGDHAELGAEEAYDFCEQHGLAQADTDLVVWLVRQHLVMSTTAQNKDLSDPEVIHKFATFCGTVERLQYLFLLTTADIRGTNPELWNSWRASLLAELYRSTKAVLERGLEHKASEAEMILQTQHQAHRLLAEEKLAVDDIEALWNSFGDEYFLRHTPQEIAWHTTGIMQHLETRSSPAEPLVLIRASRERGATLVFVYMPDASGIFARVTATLDWLNMTVVDARIISAADGYTLDTYAIIDQEGEIPCGEFTEVEDADEDNDPDGAREARLHGALLKAVSQADFHPDPKRHLPRQMRFFNLPSTVNFGNDDKHQRTVIELVSSDRPGLLSKVGEIFSQHGILIENARITTLGERAEDVFHVVDKDGMPIQSESMLMRLKREILDALDHYDDADQPKIQPTEMSA